MVKAQPGKRWVCPLAAVRVKDKGNAAVNRTTAKAPTPSEHATQAAFVQWCGLNKHRVPGIESAFAVPNGGQRNIVTASRLKASGTVPGVPDWMWGTARGAFIGLAIEFKSGDGVPSKEQRTRIDALQRDGWCVLLCWTWEAAARAVVGYAGLLRVQL